MPLIIIFLVVPLLELAVFGAVSEHIGVWSALLFALLTAIIGGNLVRAQGLQTIAGMKASADAGQVPLTEIFDGFCLVAAGALLITPGFLTDGIGFALLVPKLREILRGVIKEHTSWAAAGGSYTHSGMPRDPDVIEGEFERVDTPEDDGNKKG
ncbi:MAG: FxsA family protein [Alphaproteobacteria bacterium]